MSRSMLAFSIACLALLAGAPTASAQVISLGAAAAPGQEIEYTVGIPNVQVATGPSAPSYVVPEGAWTVTCWTTQAAIDDGGVEGNGSALLRVHRPVPNEPGAYRVIGESDERTFPFSAGDSVSFPTSIPVQGGDVIGLKSGSLGAPAQYDGTDAGDVTGMYRDPGLGGTFTVFNSGGPALVNVAASLQPTAFPPPPSCEDVTRPRIDLRFLADDIRRASVKLRFATKELAIFVVTLDGRELKDSEPPIALRSLDLGRHVVRILATDSAGNTAKERVVFRRVKG